MLWPGTPGGLPTGETSVTNQGPDRRSRIAAQRAAARRARTRNRLLLAGGAIVAVIAVVVAIVLVQGNGSSGSSSAPTAPTGAELSALVRQVTSVPTATSDAVGAGQVTSPPTSITGAALTSAGKPEVLYIGAEYCPYCAAERWAMIAALSRFGTFSGLATTHSAAKDGAGNAEPYPNTPTWTFAKASLASRYLTFTTVETETNIPDPATGGYTPLQAPTAAQQALLDKYDAANQGAIPFIDLGNKYLSVGASYNPAVLSGLTWSQIAADMHNPDTPVAKSVLGTANYLTAAMCGLTGDQPATACTPAVKALQAKI
jgi:uncharacterized protein DUF929